MDHGAQYPNPLDRSQGGRRPRCPARPCTRGAAYFRHWAPLAADSSPETSAIHARRAVRILAEATRLLMSSCISDAGIVNQRLFGARGLSMRGETICEHARERRPAPRPIHSAGPPRETSAHATPCRKTRYARRKTRTPRPCGQGVHSEPVGAPVSRAPLEVVRAGRASNDRWVPECREGWMTPRGALESGFQFARVLAPHAADAWNRTPTARATRRIVSRLGLPSSLSAL